MGSTPKGSPPDPLMRSSGWTTLTTCNIRDTMEGASSYSRGGGPARCRGFGTRGWEVVGRTWTRRPPIPYRVVVRREGSGSPTRRAPRSAFGAKGRLGYRQGHDVSLYPTTKGSTRGLDTDTTSPGILLPATLDSSCSTYLTAPGWPSCVRIAGCRARAHTRVDRQVVSGAFAFCPHSASTASRPANSQSVQQLDSEARRPGRPRDSATPVCVVAGGGRAPDSDGTYDPTPDTHGGLGGTPYRQSPLGQLAGACHRVRPPDPRWEATARATQAGNAGPRARARGRRKNHHRHQRLSIAERYHLAPLTLTRNTHSLDS